MSSPYRHSIRVTKRDTFVYMDCDEEDYWTSNQLGRVHILEGV